MSRRRGNKPLSRLSWIKTFALLAGYRREMPVNEILVISSSVYGETGYYICPRCHITMDREFMAFCDRCGQHLDWGNYKKARIIYPGQHDTFHT